MGASVGVSSSLGTSVAGVVGVGSLAGVSSSTGVTGILISAGVAGSLASVGYLAVGLLALVDPPPRLGEPRQWRGVLVLLRSGRRFDLSRIDGIFGLRG